MRQGGEPQGVQVVRQGEPTPYHCDFNPLYYSIGLPCRTSVCLLSPPRIKSSVGLLYQPNRLPESGNPLSGSLHFQAASFEAQPLFLRGWGLRLALGWAA